MFIGLRPRTPYPSPLYTLYTCIQYTCSLGKGGESWSSEKVRGATVHKAVSKILTCLTVSPVYKLWETPAAKSFTGQFFRWRHFAFVTVWYEKLFIMSWNQTCLAYLTFISYVTRACSISNKPTCTIELHKHDKHSENIKDRLMFISFCWTIPWSFWACPLLCCRAQTAAVPLLSRRSPSSKPRET